MSLYKGKNLGRVKDYHLFTTNHPYMVELGLSAFTTGTLMEWWNTTAGETFIHRSYFNDRLEGNSYGNVDIEIRDILGTLPDTAFEWQGWKPNVVIQNDGRYETQNLIGFAGSNGGQSDQAWEYDKSLWNAGNKLDNIDANRFMDDVIQDYVVIGGTLDDTGGFKAITNNDDGIGVNRFPGGGRGIREADVFGPLQVLINANRLLAHTYDWFPPKTWIKDDATSYGSPPDPEGFFALHELLTEIKSSKLGKLTWKVPVTFYVKDINLLETCQVTEEVEWTLHLFDRPNNNATQTVMALNNMSLSAPPRDPATNKSVQNTQDGETVPPNLRRLGASDLEVGDGEVVAPLDLNYNEVTNKWEGGTSNLFGVMVTDIKQAPARPAFDLLLQQDTAEQLGQVYDPDAPNKVVVSSGTALPLRIQNGNALQWAPNYKASQKDRCSEDLEKETISVFNLNTKKAFASGDEVLLTRWGDNWYVSDLGTDPDSIVDDTVEPGIQGWGEFTYLVTNAEFFFTGVETESDDYNVVDYYVESRTRITPEKWEVQFHKNFYKSLELGGFIGDTDHPQALKAYVENFDQGNGNLYPAGSGGYDQNRGFDATNRSNLQHVNGYLQLTSFDSLDSALFGTRSFGSQQTDRCAISTTLSDYTSGGVQLQLPPPFTNRNAAHSVGFFGCTFPGGYSDPKLGQYITDQREWAVGKRTNNWREPDPIFFTDNDQGNPFYAGDGVNDRNNCRLAYQPREFNVFQQMKEEDGFLDENNWSRGANGFRESRASANLFGEQVEEAGGRDDLRSMPADVMLNASPSGINGSPIYCVDTRWGDMGHMSDDYYDKALRLGMHGHWLGSTDSDIDGEYFSAFDFTPIDPTTVEFRPLKLEAFLQFGRSMHLGNGIAGNEELLSANADTVHGDYSAFKAEIIRTQLDNARPVAEYVEDRDEALKSWYCTGWGAGEDGWKLGFWQYRTDGSYDQWHIRFAGGLTEADKTRGGTYRYLHRQAYWYISPNFPGNNFVEGAFSWTKNAPWNTGPFGGRQYPIRSDWDDGAGAFGIIGTYCTVAANENITIRSTNLHGMGAAAYFNGLGYTSSVTIGIIAGLIIPGAGGNGGFNVGGGPENTTQERTWGQPQWNVGSEYSQHNVTALCARVFQGVPKEQKFYDPRLFAVHHFNSGVRYAFGKYRDPKDNGNSTKMPVSQFSRFDAAINGPWSDPYKSHRNAEYIKTPISYKVPDPESQGDFITEVIDCFYAYPQTSGDLDFRVPCVLQEEPQNHVADGQYISEPIDPTSIHSIFGNEIRFPFETRNIAPEGTWQIDSIRTGMCLPFRYRKKYLGIQWGNFDDVYSINDAKLLPRDSEDLIQDCAGQLLTYDVELDDGSPDPSQGYAGNTGQGFAVGDLIGNDQYGIKLRVNAVGEFNPFVGPGQIESLTLVDTGEGIPAGAFARTLDNDQQPMTLGDKALRYIPLSILTGNGRNIKWGWLTGKVYEKEQIDPKPLIIKNTGRNSTLVSNPDSGAAHDEQGASNIVEPNAFSTAPNVQTWNVQGDTIKSEDGTYDIFLHFHNDISSHWLAGIVDLHGSFENISESNEQHTRLQIDAF